MFKESDREKCVLEAKNLLKDNGLLFASFISINARLNNYLDNSPEDILNEKELDLFDSMEKFKLEWKFFY